MLILSEIAWLLVVFNAQKLKLILSNKTKPRITFRSSKSCSWFSFEKYEFSLDFFYQVYFPHQPSIKSKSLPNENDFDFMLQISSELSRYTLFMCLQLPLNKEALNQQMLGHAI